MAATRESAIHPVLVAGIAQFQLVHIHPFLDGNGRTSRLLSTLCLYRAGYDFKRLFTISEYYDRDRGRLLPGDPERARAGHGPDRLAGVLRRRAWPPSSARSSPAASGRCSADVVASEYGLNPRQALIVGGLPESARAAGHRRLEEFCPASIGGRSSAISRGSIARGVVKSTGGCQSGPLQVEDQGLMT